MKKEETGHFKMIFTMLIFGSIGVFVKSINLSSIDIAFLRALIGTVFLIGAGFMMKQKISLVSIKKNLILLVLSGMGIGFNWIFLFQAYEYTTLSNATLSYYFAPVFVMILSPWVLKEKLTAKKIGCILFAMLGLFLLLNAETQVDGDFEHIKGILYGLLGAGIYASIVLMNKFIKDLPGFETTLIQLFVAALILLPSFFYGGGPNLIGIDIRTWGFILVVGILHTGVAYLLYFTSMKELNGQSVAILSYIDPIFAVVLSVLFLGEGMNVLQVMGGVFILGSTLLSQREAFV